MEEETKVNGVVFFVLAATAAKLNFSVFVYPSETLTVEESAEETVGTLLTTIGPLTSELYCTVLETGGAEGSNTKGPFF